MKGTQNFTRDELLLIGDAVSQTSRQITDVGYYLSLRSSATATAMEEIGKQKELLSKLADKITGYLEE